MQFGVLQNRVGSPCEFSDIPDQLAAFQIQRGVAVGTGKKTSAFASSSPTPSESAPRTDTRPPGPVRARHPKPQRSIAIVLLSFESHPPGSFVSAHAAGLGERTMVATRSALAPKRMARSHTTGGNR
jgi:hypothetical protein